LALQGPPVSPKPPNAVPGTACSQPRSTRHARGTGRPAAPRQHSCGQRAPAARQRRGRGQAQPRHARAAPRAPRRPGRSARASRAPHRPGPAPSGAPSSPAPAARRGGHACSTPGPCMRAAAFAAAGASYHILSQPQLEERLGLGNRATGGCAGGGSERNSAAAVAQPCLRLGGPLIGPCTDCSDRGWCHRAESSCSAAR